MRVFILCFIILIKCLKIEDVVDLWGVGREYKVIRCG